MGAPMKEVASKLAFEAVEQRGHWFSTDFTSADVADLINTFGRTIFITNVTVKPNSKALVTSDLPMDFHTDHHHADLILWHCLEQSNQGGETLLLDAYDLVSGLTPEQRELLRHTLLLEHKVFPNDPGQFPVLSTHFGRDKMYYSTSMLKDDLLPTQREVLHTIKQYVAQATPICYLLKPGDILMIDNSRMLHGRRAILGDKKRMLKRYWIEKA
jgi:Taurine catabolism dioxygenase TauD, TfdA family